MSSNSKPALVTQSRDLLRMGFAAGIAGGVAEVVTVSLYDAKVGGSTPGIARHIADAVGLGTSSAWAGLAVHLALSALLGIALTFAWKRVSERSARALPLYACMLLALAGIWAMNFFVVLPLLSPGFATLLPYAVTLASKLMFGCAAAMTLHALSGARGSTGTVPFERSLARA